MRRITCLLFVAVVLGTLCGSAVAADDSKTVKLFNGACLEGWDCFTVKPEVKMQDVWSVKDGVLICKGEPLGYISTKKEFTNFELVVEWRWAPGKKPGNSGVLLRITGDSVVFLPKCVEAQLQSGSAGDIWGFYGFGLTGDKERFRKIENHDQLGTFVGVGKAKAAEKEPGEWNKYEITLDEGTLTLVVNGEQVNQATDCDVTAGKIGLQSEGGEIHFRTVELTPIEK